MNITSLEDLVAVPAVNNDQLNELRLHLVSVQITFFKGIAPQVLYGHARSIHNHVV